MSSSQVQWAHEKKARDNGAMSQKPAEMGPTAIGYWVRKSAAMFQGRIQNFEEKQWRISKPL